ncbi:MAG: Xaa-Pro peptidase family protein, partial [Thermaerobacterales bacterium]
MAAHDLDALIVVSPENVFYLTRIRLLVQRLVPDRRSFVILTADGGSTLITVASDVDHARRDASVDQVVGYGHVDSPAAVLAQTLSNNGLAKARIGIESDFIPAADLWVLADQLPGVHIVGGDTVMRLARMSKTASEIDILRRAEYSTELAVMAAFAMSFEGQREVDLARQIHKNLLDHGAEAVDFVLLSAGLNSTVYHLPPTDYPVARGDVIHLDCGGSFDNYRSDLSRNVGVGHLTEKQYDIYARLWDVQRGLVAFMAPGLTVRQLVEKYVDLMGNARLEPPSPYLGHGVGLSSHEFPELSLECDVELVPGMVLAIEPTTFIAGDARYDVEDTVAIT